MNNSTEQQTEAKITRIQVDDLPQQEQELKNKEAENVKGGGGSPGAVIQHIGEEIPQKESTLVPSTNLRGNTSEHYSSNLLAEVKGRPDHPLAQSLEASAGGVLFAFGVSGTIGFGIGGTGACVIFVLTGGDFGYYGTGAMDLGFIVELSGGACGIVYWPDAGQNALDCFRGNNAFVAVDGGEIVCGSLTFSWPEDADWKILSQTPCGVAVGLGVGVGLPVDFFDGNSTTWVDVDPPNF